MARVQVGSVSVNMTQRSKILIFGILGCILVLSVAINGYLGYRLKISSLLSQIQQAREEGYQKGLADERDILLNEIIDATRKTPVEITDTRTKEKIKLFSESFLKSMQEQEKQ